MCVSVCLAYNGEKSNIDTILTYRQVSLSALSNIRAIVNGGILPVNDTIFFHFLLLFKSLLTSSFVSFLSFITP